MSKQIADKYSSPDLMFTSRALWTSGRYKLEAGSEGSLWQVYANTASPDEVQKLTNKMLATITDT